MSAQRSRAKRLVAMCPFCGNTFEARYILTPFPLVISWTAPGCGHDVLLPGEFEDHIRQEIERT